MSAQLGQGGGRGEEEDERERSGEGLTPDLSIGAGGAITWLSDRQEEWTEVLTKVQSVVGPLGV